VKKIVIDAPLLYEASMAWAPDFPRQSTYGRGAQQRAVESKVHLTENLKAAAESGGPGYCSVYSFPRGHSRDDNIPKINTVFLDLDIPKSQGVYDPQDGGSTQDWRRDMSKLLVRARMVARVALDADLAKHFRVAYSGHKGIHFYIDFPEVGSKLGPIQQYKNGISAYADEMIDYLSDKAGVRLHDWVDVTSHDLGRLARHPNTPHHGAEHVDWTPYCVPGSMEELAGLDPDGYLEVTKEPRPPIGTGRDPSQQAHDKLTEDIKDASESQSMSNPGQSQHRDEGVLNDYRELSNEEITVETVRELLIKGKPCIAEWADRDDAYKHGQSSRIMEISVIKELSSHEVPIDVMVEFFSDIPRFDETYTRNLIKDIIARYYPSSFVCRNVVEQAPQFCLGDECHIYRRSEDLEL
jgi:hypothetical protein